MATKSLPDYKKINGFCVPAFFSEEAWLEALRFKPTSRNVFLATYPKCGTNWAQQILLLIVKKGVPPIDGYEFYNECPHIEMTGLDKLEESKDPQLVKIHLPFNMAPYSPDAKYIFVARNPKDCLVSYYHHTATRLYSYEDGEFDDYFDLFLDGAVDYGDFFDHVLSWYEHRNDPNVLFLYYEDMKKDIKSTIFKMAEFMGPRHLEAVRDPSIFSDIIRLSSFEYMKDVFNKHNDKTFELGLDPNISLEKLPLPSGYVYTYNYLRNKGMRETGITLVRKGVAGGWRNAFSEDQNRRMNDKMESKLKGTDMLKFWKENGCI